MIVTGYYVSIEKDVNLYVEDLNPECENTIVFLHGWPGSHKLFEYQFNEFYKMNYRCIGIDQRGFGKSDKPATGYDYDRLSDDVYAVIQALGLSDVTLLGHSTGGAIAVRYMARHHACGVGRLVLCAAAAPSLICRDYFPYGQNPEAIADIINGTYEDRPKMLRTFGDQFFYQLISKPFSDWFFSLGLEAAGWATAEIAKTWLGEEELFEDLKKIQVPTLIMHGVHDKVCYFALGEAQHEAICNSVFVPFMQSGHGLFYDERDHFNSELDCFIKNNR